VAPAPGLLSTKTGTFQRSLKKSAIQRDEMSPPPPGAKPTMMVTCLDGNLSGAWACAVLKAHSDAMNIIIFEIEIDMLVSFY
jgi:hypothetical protein